MTKIMETEKEREALGLVCESWLERLAAVLGEPEVETLLGQSLTVADIEWRQGRFEDSLVRCVMIYELLIQDPHYETSARDLWTKTHH